MSSNLSVQQVLKVLFPTFRSIDVRTVSFCVDDTDYNIVTVIGFGEHDPSAQKTRLDKLVQSHSSFGDPRLKFRFKVEAAEGWDSVIAELRSGALNFHDGKVELLRVLEILDSKGYIDSINFLRRWTEWPVFEAHASWNPNQQDSQQTALAQKLRYVQQDEDLVRNLNANGYRSLKDVFRTFLDSRPDSEPGYTSDVYVAAPVFASIRNLRCSPTQNQLSITYDCDPKLQPNIRVYGEHRTGHNETERILFRTPECSTRECVTGGDLALSDRTSVVSVWLGHSDLGHLTERSATPRELMPPEEINPLWHLLQVFCQSSKVEELLTTPPRPNDKRPKEQRYFEQHIGWLLAVHGYSVVILGEFESLKAPGSVVEQGSLDILAYHKERNKVLLGSCTMAPPEERDYGNLVNVRSHVFSRINRDVSFTSEMAIFSSAAECVAPPQYAGGGSYVALFDASDLRGIVENLNAGRDNEFFEKLDGHRFAGLGGIVPGLGFAYE